MVTPSRSLGKTIICRLLSLKLDGSYAWEAKYLARTIIDHEEGQVDDVPEHFTIRGQITKGSRE